MKKKKNLLSILVTLTVGCLVSCNSKPSNGNGGPTVTPPVTQAGSTKAVAPGNTFYTLSLDSASLVQLLDKDTKQLIVQFAYQNSSDTALSLVAYGAKSNNVKTTGPIALTPLSNPVTTYGSPVILGDQELTLKSIKTVLGLNGSGQIKAADLRSFKFVPLKDGNNHIYYAVTKLGAAANSGAAVTNPSPPAPPCEGGCDY